MVTWKVQCKNLEFEKVKADKFTIDANGVLCFWVLHPYHPNEDYMTFAYNSGEWIKVSYIDY